MPGNSRFQALPGNDKPEALPQADDERQSLSNGHSQAEPGNEAIYYADLNPTVGSETAKRRPVLLVSNDANNRAASTVTILPITSSVSRVYPFEVLLQTEESGLPKLSKVQPQQTNSRFQAKLGNEANETNL